MNLRIYIPDYLVEVSKIVLETIEDRMIGINFEVLPHEKEHYQVEDLNKESKFQFPALFIQEEKEKWLTKRKTQEWGLKYFSYRDIDQLPVLFNGEPLKDVDKISIDFIGSIFFLLHRYHEQVEELPKDNFGRIYSKDSFLVRNKLHSRPWADIYIELFRDILEEKFSVHIPLKGEFSIMPTHDVDRPFEFLYYTFPHLIKRFSGDVLKKKSLTEAKKRLNLYKSVKSGNLTVDPLNTFDWIMEQSEKAGCVSTFHFIAESTNVQFDQDYDLQDKEIQGLLESIYDRGHEFGLHPSYGATEIGGQIKKEFLKLKELTQQYTEQRKLWRSRNHYLRWNENTISELELAGIDIDQTLGFPALPGFRCGTSYSFKAFNFQSNSVSSVVIEPLIVMEVSLFDSSYLNLGDNLSEAWNLIDGLKRECIRYGGNFTILWHNNHLIEEKFKSFYMECLK